MELLNNFASPDSKSLLINTLSFLNSPNEIIPIPQIESVEKEEPLREDGYQISVQVLNQSD